MRDLERHIDGARMRGFLAQGVAQLPESPRATWESEGLFSPSPGNDTVRMDLEARIRAAIDGMPDDGSVLLSVKWLRSALGDDAGDECSDFGVGEMAELVDRSESTVRGWLAKGLIPEAYRGTADEWRIPRTAAHAARGRIRAGRFFRPSPDVVPDLSTWRMTVG